MNAQQMLRQAQACHIRFKQLLADGAIPGGTTVYDYAGQIVGRSVDSLKLLTPSELNVLRDALEGKPSKVYDAICRHAADAGIFDLNAWVRACARSATMAWLRGYAKVQAMPVHKQWRLCRLLEVRARAIHPERDAAGPATVQGPRAPHPQEMRVICAWCRRVLVDAPESNGISHGVCLDCKAKVTATTPARA